MAKNFGRNKPVNLDQMLLYSLLPSIRYKRLLILCMCAVLMTACHKAQEESWVFISMPDFLNVDCDYPEPLWEEALSFILQSIKREDPAFVVIAGDIVMGHWDGPTWNDADSINKYARRYYTSWKRRMEHHDLKYYVSIGDHEVGDNPWKTPKKLAAVELYKAAFASYLQMPKNGPSDMQGTAFWWTHGDVLFMSVDVFEEGVSDQGLIKADVSGDQLEWLEEVLASHKNIGHKVVFGHTPILGPVRKWSSSGLMLHGGRESDFWQLMKQYGVDAYLCGEVHAVTCTERDGVFQIAHGGLIGYNTRTNYLVCTVYKDRLEMEIREIEMQLSGVHKWQTKNNRPLERVSISPELKEGGFYSIGSLTIDKSHQKKYLNRKGYFRKEYETSTFRGVPFFRRDNPQGLPHEPPLIRTKK